jgi:hypothetical protein
MFDGWYVLLTNSLDPSKIVAVFKRAGHNPMHFQGVSYPVFGLPVKAAKPRTAIPKLLIWKGGRRRKLSAARGGAGRKEDWRG